MEVIKQNPEQNAQIVDKVASLKEVRYSNTLDLCNAMIESQPTQGFSTTISSKRRFRTRTCISTRNL